MSHVFVYIKNQPIDFKIKDLNIHNVLSSLAVLKELKVDISKLKINLKFMTLQREEEKNILYLDTKRDLNLLMKVIMLIHYQ